MKAVKDKGSMVEIRKLKSNINEKSVRGKFKKVVQKISNHVEKEFGK